MHHITRDHLFILPHAEEYRQFYGVSIEDILSCLNAPDTNEGLTTGRYTAEKALHDHRLYLSYYLTLPLQATDNDYFAIIDFIGSTGTEDRPPTDRPVASQPENHDNSPHG